MTDSKLLAVEKLTVGFITRDRRQLVVKGISLSLGRGETLALVGESGCGKTVTALAILGLLPENARVGGVIAYAGTDLQTLSSEHRRTYRGRKMAMVFQEPTTSLNPVFPVGEQVAEAMRFHHSLSARQAWEQAVSLLEEVRVPDPRSTARAYPHQLSGGMRQRVVLAAALACDPQLLVADEPTTALDVTVQAEILLLLDRIRRNRRMSLIFITHDLALVPGLAEKVVVMCAGQLVESGPAEKVLAFPAHPYTRSLVESQPELWPQGGPVPVPSNLTKKALTQDRGCPYLARCPFGRSACGDRFPPPVVLHDRGWVACLPEVAGLLASREVLP
jgi:oligopeptide/dipeptide ABC transporter ATP-binding protein